MTTISKARIMQVFDTIKAKGPLTAAEISDHLDMPKSSVRVATTLLVREEAVLRFGSALQSYKFKCIAPTFTMEQPVFNRHMVPMLDVPIVRWGLGV